MAGPNKQEAEAELPALGPAILSGTVTLKIEPDGPKYYVHKALLLHHSEYFRRALIGPCTEATERTISLEDVARATVNVFIHWLYTQHLPASSDLDEWMRIAGEDSDDHYSVRINSYTFADRFLIPGFGCAVHNNLVDWIQRTDVFAELDLVVSWFGEAFHLVPPDRSFLQLLVNEYCDASKEWCKEPSAEFTGLPVEFLVRAMRRQSDVYGGALGSRACANHTCYYEHPNEAETIACGKVHMTYDEVKDYGFFKKTVPCSETCRTDG